jgi:hypothetical protein
MDETKSGQDCIACCRLPGGTAVREPPRGDTSNIISLQGMHAATASTVGWIEVQEAGSECLFCAEP